MNTGNPLSELLVTTPTLVGAAVAGAAMLVRLIAYAMKIRAWRIRQELVLRASPDQIAHLENPPEIPESLLKVMNIAILLGFATACLAVLWRSGQITAHLPEPPVEVRQERVAADGGAQSLQPPAQTFAQACTSDSQCPGKGCGCKDGECRCLTVQPDKAQPQPVKQQRPQRDKGKGGGEKGSASAGGPSSSIAVYRTEVMAGTCSVNQSL